MPFWKRVNQGDSVVNWPTWLAEPLAVCWSVIMGAYNHLLTQAKQDYLKTKTETAETSKDLYKVCDNLLNRWRKSVLTSHDCVKDLADKFVTYFNDRISNIRKDLEKAPISTSQTSQDIFNKFGGEVLDSFTEVSEDDIRKIINSSPTKSCALDPIPTWLLKKCEDNWYLYSH